MKIRKRDTDYISKLQAGIVTARAVLEDVPYASIIQDAAKALHPSSVNEFVGDQMRQRIPGAIQWVAQRMDRDSQGNPIARKPVTISDYIKQGIPWWRQQVPEKSASTRSIFQPPKKTSKKTSTSIFGVGGG
jgi:hypothetical protein